MNREIIFRGKREKTGEWVYGYLIKRDEPFLHDIVVPVGNTSQVSYAIIRGTVGQYTGMSDCKGNRIFEGDILKYNWKDKEVIDFIEFRPAMFTYSGSIRISLDQDEVIGNRWDNPELLVTE